MDTLVEHPAQAHEAELAEETRTRRALLHMLEDLQRERAGLRDARQSWLRTVDALGDPLMVHDADFRVVRCNRAYALRAGMEFVQIIGRPYWECFPRRAGPLDTCLLPISEKDTHETELKLDTGEIFISRAYAVGADKIPHALHLFENVTTKRAVEKALRESEEKFRAIFDHSLDGIVVMDIEAHSVRFANGGMERLLGYSRGQLADVHMSRLHPPEALAQIVQQFDQAAAGGLNYVQDMPLCRQDGQVVYADVSGAVVKIGDESYLLGAFRDATQRRASEQKVRANLEELQRWQALNLDREDRVVELKQEVNELLARLNQAPRYASVA